jgi:hypothetical protein
MFRGGPIMKAEIVKCQYCTAEIPAGSTVCPYCNKIIPLVNDTPGKKPKQWSVFWPALVVGLVLGYFLARRFMFTFRNNPELTLSQVINLTWGIYFIGIFFYGGLYSLIVWIKRAFIKHELGVSRFSKKTGFISLLFFVLGFIIIELLTTLFS